MFGMFYYVAITSQLFIYIYIYEFSIITFLSMVITKYRNLIFFFFLGTFSSCIRPHIYLFILRGDYSLEGIFIQFHERMEIPPTIKIKMVKYFMQMGKKEEENNVCIY